jgi:hypothetical protein
MDVMADAANHGNLPSSQGLMRHLILQAHDTLLTMVGTARTRHNHLWLRTMATEATALQYDSLDWIRTHIWNLPVQRRGGGPLDNRDRSTLFRDVRLDANPDLDGRLDILHRPPSSRRRPPSSRLF